MCPAEEIATALKETFAKAMAQDPAAAADIARAMVQSHCKLETLIEHVLIGTKQTLPLQLYGGNWKNMQISYTGQCSCTVL